MLHSVCCAYCTLSADVGLRLLPSSFQCDLKWLTQTSQGCLMVTVLVRRNRSTWVMSLHLHASDMRAAPATIVQQDHIIACNSGINGSTIVSSIHTFEGEWKPCAVQVTDGQTGETCWQLWTALRCRSAWNNSTKLSALVLSVGKQPLLPLLAVSQSHVTTPQCLPVIDSLKRAHMVSLGVFLIRLGFNGFFLASDRQGSGGEDSRPAGGVIWTLWLQSRVSRHKEPTLRSQVSDRARVRKSGDCKPHPTRSPSPHQTRHDHPSGFLRTLLGTFVVRLERKS